MKKKIFYKKTYSFFPYNHWLLLTWVLEEKYLMFLSATKSMKHLRRMSISLISSGNTGEFKRLWISSSSIVTFAFGSIFVEANTTLLPSLFFFRLYWRSSRCSLFSTKSAKIEVNRPDRFGWTIKINITILVIAFNQKSYLVSFQY